ncbi:MAG TPA: carboxymuconolactone decarboxylase family protein [Acidimicrobiia bacterium]|nr:carboxymuconolactone decarboxylase family protein [Acidimicrobiia bacterium]
MPDYLPEVYEQFRHDFPDVARAQDALAQSVHTTGPLDERSIRLVTLGIAIGALAQGAVRSNARRALDAGLQPGEIRHAALCAITTRGFPATIAALGWIDEVLASEEPKPR